MNTQDDPETLIPSIVAVKKHLGPDQVTRDKNFRDDLHVSSLDALEILMSVEDRFNIEIPDDDSLGLETVGDLIEDVCRRMHLASPQ